MANIYAYNLINNKMKRKLILSPISELKIKTALLKMGNLEVSWFGTIEEKEGNFELLDIFFPPQENKPTFVTTKDSEYPQWFFETFTKKGTNHLVRLHGHTHPNFSVTPSGVDMEQFSKLMDEVPFMIQFIINNSFQTTCILYKQEGTTGEPLEVFFPSEEIKKDIEEKITKETYTYVGQYLGFGNANINPPTYGRRSPYIGSTLIDEIYDDYYSPKERNTKTIEPKKDVKLKKDLEETKKEIKTFLSSVLNASITDMELNELIKGETTSKGMIKRICKEFKITMSEYYFNLNSLRGTNHA